MTSRRTSASPLSSFLNNVPSMSSCSDLSLRLKFDMWEHVQRMINFRVTASYLQFITWFHWKVLKLSGLKINSCTQITIIHLPCKPGEYCIFEQDHSIVLLTEKKMSMIHFKIFLMIWKCVLLIWMLLWRTYICSIILQLYFNGNS
jgi:hypothetical protein